jgi:hypothetical protein
MTPSGIEPATFRFVAQYQLLGCTPNYEYYYRSDNPHQTLNSVSCLDQGPVQNTAECHALSTVLVFLQAV